jgi:cytoskeletal protein RodZ
MTSVGQKLRGERVRRGIDIPQLASDTRINPKYLEAIEADDTCAIPGGFFYRSFVRQYAVALGMDAAALDRDLEHARQVEAPALLAALENAQFPLKAPDPIVVATNRRIASRRIGAYILMLVGVVAGCGAVYSWWSGKEVQVALRPSDPGALIPPTAAVEAPMEQPPAVQPPITQQPVAVINTAESSNAKVVLAIAAREKTWLTMTADGKMFFSGTLEPSETKVVGGNVRAWVKVGNAAGLEITWNGKPLGQIGHRGEVMTLVFTPENYQILPRAGSL